MQKNGLAPKQNNRLLLVCFLILSAPVFSSAQICGSVNIAQGKPVVVSSEWEFRPSSAAVDGNIATGWAVAPGSPDTAYIYVDLGQSASLCHIKISWDSVGMAKDYVAQTSTDATNWTTIFTRTNNSSKIDGFNVTGTGRYLRIYMTAKVIFWANYQIVELEAYNYLSNFKPSVSLTAPVNNATAIAGTNIKLTANASDPDGSIAKVEFYQDSVKIGESLTAPYEFTWSNVQPGSYQLRARAYDNTNADTISAAVHLTVNPSTRWSVSGNTGINPDSNFIGTLDNKKLVFRTNNTAKMTILPNGFVGVGIDHFTDSTVKMAINGTLAAQKIKVTQDGWADYVFEKNYRLMKLPALEAFIRQHQHLPDVPTTQDVQKAGTDIANTQELLLRKIEELTLYIIDQNKRIEQLETIHHRKRK